MTGVLTTLFDTSAFVGFLSKTDQFHGEATACLQGLTGRFVTTWPVVTEAHYLLRGVPNGRVKLMELFSAGEIEIIDVQDQFLKRVSELAERYSDRDVQLADASLIWLAEMLGTDRVFTFDRADFGVYRIDRGHQRSSFEILPEP